MEILSRRTSWLAFGIGTNLPQLGIPRVLTCNFQKRRRRHEVPVASRPSGSSANHKGTISSSKRETKNSRLRAQRPQPNVSGLKKENYSGREKGVIKGALSLAGSAQSVIQWYPGHIAKAERTLKDSLKLVDVVIEVRDCRIPIATAHPEVRTWIGSRPRVLAMNRADLVPDVARSTWRDYLVSSGEEPRFINAREGRGVRELKKLALSVGSDVNAKRAKRGLRPRPIRCVVIGYPNVGKSALINRLVDKRVAKSANKPGVTRNFQWIRISESIELLDMPGIIPAKFISQETAVRLAICDDIGQGGYDVQLVATSMIEEFQRVANQFPGFVDLSLLEQRFEVDPRSGTGEDFVHRCANKLYRGDVERTCRRLLTEFRAGDLGKIALECPRMLLDLSKGKPSSSDCTAT